MMASPLLSLLALGNAGLLVGYAVSARCLRKGNASLQTRLAAATRELLQGKAEQKATSPLHEPRIQGLAIVAHDLRNPLHGIMLASELMEETTDNLDVPRIARMIQGECREMDQLIGRFLDFAAIEAGSFQGEPCMLALGDSIRLVAERHALRAQQKGIQLVLELNPDTAPVFLDESYTKAILDNLLGNAIKFSPSGTTVTLRLGNLKGRVRLSVEDQGPGFTLQDQDLLFQRFTKLSATPTGGERSLGLGLSIVKHMVDAMGGNIWVVTAPGEGAAFQVEFPAALTKEV